MRFRLTAIIALTVFAAACSPKESAPVDYVDPFIGTAGHGHTYPGATTPFGAVQLSPDNYRYDWDACSGYHYDHDAIYGFSHTHLSGTGCADLADILFHPMTGDVDLSREGDIYEPLAFSHKDEVAEPGYYSVYFKKEGVKAEMTATAHVGWHRYSWVKGKPHNLVIDMHHEINYEKIHEVEIYQSAPNEIRGMRKTTSWTPDQYVYFIAKFSRPIKAIRYIDSHKEVSSAEECVSDDRQVVLSFGDEGGQVIARVGVSITGYDGANKNLFSEDSGIPFNFDEIRTQARYDWNSLLSRISVEGGTKAQKRAFYTALYHTAVVPNVTSDVDHFYRRQDGAISKVPWGDFYSTLSLWDTFRAWLPLSSFIYPEVLHDITYSCLDMYISQGELPIWPLSSGETDCMIGYHSVPFIVDAFLKGLVPEMNARLALDAMVDSSNKNEKGSEYYSAMGYIPANRAGESVSCLLEYAYDDWCIAYFAQKLGERDIADEYYKRAYNYLNVYDGSTGFFRGKNVDGTFVEPFNTFEPAREYTEATAWQYRYFVPHDFAGFSCLLGGREALAQAVDDCFAAKEDVDGFRSDITGLLGQYAHGNEPSHHMAYIYDYVGQPWKTQEWTRRICREMYSDKPDGLCGNEDCGQMSAWYVMTALGLYEVCPGTLQFALTSPMFDKVTLATPSGNNLVITADNPAKNTYIQKVTLNGKEIDKAYVTWSELMEGGELHFELGPKPDYDLWTSEDAAPYSLTKEAFVAKPYYKASDSVTIFLDAMTLELGCATEGATLRYTLDGSPVTAESPVYTVPLNITEDTFVRARAFKQGLGDSAELAFQCTKAVALEPAEGRFSQNGIHYDFYHGDFSKTAEILEKGEFISEGTMPDFSLEPADRDDYYGFIYKGYIRIPEERIWKFGLMCDDGGVLYISDKLVVDNDGTHSVSFVTGRALLKEGVYPFELRYIESYEDQALGLAWEKDGKFEKIPVENLYIK